MKTLLETKFGSHLYGMDTPNSDTDFKSIIVPDFEFVISEKRWTHVESTGASNVRNTSDDIDRESYSLHGFLQKAYAGDTGAIDMLHATSKSTTISTPEWEFLRDNREKFYTKNMRGYIGYCRKQATKYGLRGSRVAAIENVLKFISEKSKLDGFEKMTIGDTLNEMVQLQGEFIKFVDGYYYKKGKWIDKPSMIVCESKYEYTSRLTIVEDSLKSKIASYGDREELIKNADAGAYKRLHHALRAGYQIRDIYKFGDFEYPLNERNYLIDVKLGLIPFEDVMRTLEDLIKSVVDLNDKSKLPLCVDTKLFEEFKNDVYASALSLQK